MAIMRPSLVFDHVTVINNKIARDPDLSMGEKGILLYILSHAAGYELTMKQMVAENRNGWEAINNALKGLESRGYLQRVRMRSEDGRLGGYDWTVTVDELGNPTGGSTSTGKPGLAATCGNATKAQVATSLGKPSMGKPGDNKKEQLFIEVQEELKNTSSPADAGDALFDEFWKVYPAKKGKIAARKAWTKAIKIATADEIIAGALVYRTDSRVIAGYIKDPATWLNGGCWADEPTPERVRRVEYQGPYRNPTDDSEYEQDLAEVLRSRSAAQAW